MISQASRSSSRNGTRSSSTSTPAPSRAISASEEASPGAAVLQRVDEPGLHQLLARLDQLLAGEGIADLDRRSLVGILLAQLLAREHARAADAVAPVVAPYRTMTPLLALARVSRSFGTRPTHIALTRQLPR